MLISDGRANIPLSVSVGEDTPAADGGLDPAAAAAVAALDPKKGAALSAEEKKQARTALKDEVITIAKQIGAMSQFKLLVIDTENKFVSTGVAKEIATAANGRYHYIPKASASAMSQVAAEAVASLKSQQR